MQPQQPQQYTANQQQPGGAAYPQAPHPGQPGQPAPTGSPAPTARPQLPPGYPAQAPQQQMVPAQPGYPQQARPPQRGQVMPAPQQVPQQAQAQAGARQQAQPTQPPRPKNTTQNSLLFSEIRDNMMIMSDGSFRAVVACKSINFDLMSSNERDAVEFSYQNFINSLTHPVQILVRSQKVDIGPYLERLTNIRKTQDNMLLGVLMDDYIDFIDILSEEANIMDKTFYVVIPYSIVGDLSNIKDNGKGFFQRMFGGGQSMTKIDKLSYQKAKDEIKNRVDSITGGLMAIGVHSKQLNSRELGKLYYNYYNPDTAVREPLGNFEQNTFTYVKKGEGQAPRPDMTVGGTM